MDIQYQINSAILACTARVQAGQDPNSALIFLQEDVDLIFQGVEAYEVN